MALANIKVGHRFREEAGDLTELKTSIVKVGLINPITVDANGQLIAGYRRLRALQSLGRTATGVNVIDTLGDAIKAIELERDENTCRLEMTKGELAKMAAALADIESDRARERQREHGGTAPGRSANTCGPSATSDSSGENSEQTGRVRELVGRALGVGERTAGDLIIVGKAVRSDDETERTAAVAALREMDETGTVRAPADRFREATGRKLGSATAPSSRNRVSPKNGREYPRKTDMVRPQDQEEILEKVSGACRGLGDMLADIMGRISNEVHPEVNKAKTSQLVEDLRFARTAMTRMIKVLEGNNT